MAMHFSPPTLSPTTIHVCTTCRAGQPLPEGATPPGQAFYDVVASLAGPHLRVLPVKCLSSCDHGCAAAISAPGKWTYLLGRLDPALAPDLLAYAATYAQHPTGTVLPSKRPPSLARIILGRMPDLAPTHLAPTHLAPTHPVPTQPVPTQPVPTQPAQTPLGLAAE